MSGTVTNKTTGKPSAGDKVELVDVQAGMAAVATATTDSRGHYTLNEPGAGPYLIRATHEGAGYFIAAPQGGGPGDIGVYDTAAKVNGVSVEAEIYQVETQNDQLSVSISWVVHNASSPKLTEVGNSTFEFALPSGRGVRRSAGHAPQRPAHHGRAQGTGQRTLRVQCAH